MSLYVASPTYTIKVTITDRMVPQAGQFAAAAGGGILPVQMAQPRPHRFYDGLNHKTGCDEVMAAVRKAFADAGLTNVEVSFERFEYR